MTHKKKQEESRVPMRVFSYGGGVQSTAAKVGIGISLDEWHRMRKGIDPEKPWKELDYPLIDLRLDRQDCINVIVQAGLPVPPKSSCFFCPFHTIAVWQEMRNNQPALFQKACHLEDLMLKRSRALGKGDIWFTGKQKPLVHVTTDHVQGNLFEDDQMCESGYCFV